MNSMTLVRIIPRNGLILDELHDILLFFLLGILNPEIQVSWRQCKSIDQRTLVI